MRCSKPTSPVLKVMYDRGNIKQVLKGHQIVLPVEYTADEVKLPAPAEIPHIDMENRVYVEMMVHVEGPIIEAFYDICLLSWGNALRPPLPLLANPSAPPPEYRFQDDHAHIASKDLDSHRVRRGSRARSRGTRTAYCTRKWNFKA
ncbi:hypothetical protein HWV62_31183 [Athelia sp. TMB]|nr:hypothetical protein HWV62_31183 [Athelia sp. TMB]